MMRPEVIWGCVPPSAGSGDASPAKFWALAVVVVLVFMSAAGVPEPSETDVAASDSRATTLPSAGLESGNQRTTPIAEANVQIGWPCGGDEPMLGRGSDGRKSFLAGWRCP